jgi:hypothetical protein
MQKCLPLAAFRRPVCALLCACASGPHAAVYCSAAAQFQATKGSCRHVNTVHQTQEQLRVLIKGLMHAVALGEALQARILHHLGGKQPHTDLSCLAFTIRYIRRIYVNTYDIQNTYGTTLIIGKSIFTRRGRSSQRSSAQRRLRSKLCSGHLF